MTDSSGTAHWTRNPELKAEDEGKSLIDSSQLVRVEATG